MTMKFNAQSLIWAAKQRFKKKKDVLFGKCIKKTWSNSQAVVQCQCSGKRPHTFHLYHLLGYQGRLWRHILPMLRVFTINSSRTRVWWRRSTSSFETSPFMDLLLLILAYMCVKHARQWRGFPLRTPTAPDLRKHSMTRSRKWPQQTLEVDTWVEIRRYSAGGKTLCKRM